MKARISRRTFLAAAAAAPLSAASSSRVLGANDAIRIGVIGCGVRGLALMSQMSRCTGAIVAGVSDVFEPRRARARAFTQAAVHPDWRDLVGRAGLDAVIIATPDHWHATMAIAAMESGKDVYCEGPMALRFEEAATFRDCAARTGRVVQIGAQLASESQWHVAGELIRSGAIGKPVWSHGSLEPVDAVRGGYAPGEAAPTPDTLDWAGFVGPSAQHGFDPAHYLQWRNYSDYSGGVAMERFYDQLAALLIALGPAFPRRVSAAGGVYARDNRDVPDMLVMTAEYAAGHTVVLASSMAHALPPVIRGQRASIELRGHSVRVVPEYGFDAADRILRVPARPSHLDNWLECIRTRQACVCNEEVGYCAMAAIAMAMESYRTGKMLCFDAHSGRVVSSPPRVAQSA